MDEQPPALVPPSGLSPGVKRSHDGQAITHTSNLQPAQLPSAARASSPALSTASSLTDLSSSRAAQTPGQTLANTTTASPNKKRKLTFAERQVQLVEKQREKADKERLKAEEKAKREEEKRLKDEEKRQKAEEKEAAKKAKEVEKAQKDAVKAAEKQAKDAKKAEKDAEKAKKEADKMKKERVSGSTPSTLMSVWLIFSRLKCGSVLSSAPLSPRRRPQLRTISQLVSPVGVLLSHLSTWRNQPWKTSRSSNPSIQNSASGSCPSFPPNTPRLLHTIDSCSTAHAQTGLQSGSKHPFSSWTTLPLFSDAYSAQQNPGPNTFALSRTSYLNWVEAQTGRST
jgi:hypothetical protein